MTGNTRKFLPVPVAMTEGARKASTSSGKQKHLRKLRTLLQPASPVLELHGAHVARQIRHFAGCDCSHFTSSQVHTTHFYLYERSWVAASRICLLFWIGLYAIVPDRGTIVPSPQASNLLEIDCDCFDWNYIWKDRLVANA